MTIRRRSPRRRSARSPSGVHEFREERRVALNSTKIEEVIGVLKTKEAPRLQIDLASASR